MSRSCPGSCTALTGTLADKNVPLVTMNGSANSQRKSFSKPEGIQHLAGIKGITTESYEDLLNELRAYDSTIKFGYHDMNSTHHVVMLPDETISGAGKNVTDTFPYVSAGERSERAVERPNSKVQAHPHPNLESLKKSLEADWAKLSPEYLRATVEAFPKRLKDVVKNKGNRIEQI
ncbi:unnamed protein product [Caenorhabditis sp. 36 PRJEB53466]|nr:unnamed protein product [Caenorhabditis sp. 36 PRJEB53466]